MFVGGGGSVGLCAAEERGPAGAAGLGAVVVHVEEEQLGAVDGERRPRAHPLVPAVFCAESVRSVASAKIIVGYVIALRKDDGWM